MYRKPSIVFLREHFSSFLNRIRIKDYKRLIQDKSILHYTHEGIAKEVGFASKSAFYRYFKAIEGSSPSKLQLQKAS